MTTTPRPFEAIQGKVDDLANNNVNSVDQNVRYLAYSARVKTALRSSARYIAYTSDVGEAFRPVIPPWIVTAAYGVSWLYLSGDVGYETYKAHKRGPNPIEASNFSEPTRLAFTAVERATFQSIASMALPALTIHTAVSQSKRFFIKATSPRVKAWGPTMTGLAIVPILPLLFDRPVENVTEHVFSWIRNRLIEHNQIEGNTALEEKQDL